MVFLPSIFTKSRLSDKDFYCKINTNANFKNSERNKMNKKINIIVLTLILCSLTFISTNMNETNSVSAAIDTPTIDELYFNHTIDINVVFLGFDGYGIDTEYWDQELLDWYSPFPSYSSYETYPIFYNYEFNYIFTNTTTTNDFFNYLDSIAFTQPNPVPSYLVDWGFSPGTYIEAVSATSIEYWLASQFYYLPGYTLALINSWDYIYYYYSYAVDFIEPDTGVSQYEGYLNCWAGNNTLAFYDYTTPPANHGSGYSWGWANNVTYVPTIEESWNGTDFDSDVINNDLIKITQFTCDLVFTPSYLYRPLPYENYVFYYLIVDCTSDYYVLYNALDFIDPSKIRNSYNYILPTVNWDFNFKMLNLTLDTTLQTMVSNYYDDYGSYGILRATEGGINDYMETYWSSYENETTKVLPTIFFVFDKVTWYDSQYTIARANGKDGEGWEVVGTLDKAMTYGGTTGLAAHESGHFIGLRHPHDGWSWKLYLDSGYGEFAYWLWDYQASTMTYAYNYPYFNKMNQWQLYRGRTLELLSETYDTIVLAYEELVNRGFTSSPTEFTTQLSSVETELNWAEINMNYYLYKTSETDARLALAEANILLEIAQTAIVIPEMGSISLSLLVIIGLISTLSLAYISLRRK